MIGGGKVRTHTLYVTMLATVEMKLVSEVRFHFRSHLMRNSSAILQERIAIMNKLPNVEVIGTGKTFTSEPHGVVHPLATALGKVYKSLVNRVISPPPPHTSVVYIDESVVTFTRGPAAFYEFKRLVAQV